MFDLLESVVRLLVVSITNWLPVKVIRDDRGRPFLYRYHLFSLTKDGPGICFHHFVKSDPDRGYHDHPWSKACSFILAGSYSERILDLSDNKSIKTYERNRWNFNYLNGRDTFHRVILPEEGDAWTIFFYGKRAKTWGMVSLDGEYHAMSDQVEDNDGGWWLEHDTGYSVDHHFPQPGNIVATVDTMVIAEDKLLLIKRGKEPFKDDWAFPGGRIDGTDRDTVEAAKRELKEETSIDVDKLDLSNHLTYLTTIGNNTRDPRGFCLTNVFLLILDKIPENVKAGDDAVDYQWVYIGDWFESGEESKPKMAFDHRKILEEEYLLS